MDKYEKKGWIRKSKSLAAALTFFVPKPNGGKRKVQDYRKLNEITIKNRYPLPISKKQLTGSPEPTGSLRSTYETPSTAFE